MTDNDDKKEFWEILQYGFIIDEEPSQLYMSEGNHFVEEGSFVMHPHNPMKNLNDTEVLIYFKKSYMAVDENGKDVRRIAYDHLSLEEYVKKSLSVINIYREIWNQTRACVLVVTDEYGIEEVEVF